MKRSNMVKWLLSAIFAGLIICLLGGLLFFNIILPVKHVTIYLNPLQAEVLVGQQPYIIGFATITRTPFLAGEPATTTPTPRDTSTPTLTPNPTLTPTPSQTATPSFTPTFTVTNTPLPTDTPMPTDTPSGPPSSAYISNISGHHQLYTLDCEARSSVDLAAYFGIDIDENDFLNRLPRSDDPNEGFVGNLGDPRGQIPPNSYGVHAAPIAALLREYGLNASAQYGFGFESLKSEIAAGRPVIAWVIGNTTSGFGTSYTPSNGNTTIVAPYEHTVLVIGYNSDTVTLLDENNIYNRSTSTFVNSWAVLGNMAVTVAN